MINFYEWANKGTILDNLEEIVIHCYAIYLAGIAFTIRHLNRRMLSNFGANVLVCLINARSNYELDENASDTNHLRCKSAAAKPTRSWSAHPLPRSGMCRLCCDCFDLLPIYR